MSIFAFLDTEGKLQIADKTRLSAAKSFAAKNDTAITTATITPELTATPINIFNADPNQWFLDWAYSDFLFDVDATTGAIPFKVGSSMKNVSITPGKYQLSDLPALMKTAMETADPGSTKTWTYNATTRQFSLVSSNTITIYPSGLLEHLRFKESINGKSFEGDPIEYVIKKAVVDIQSASSSASKHSYIKVFDDTGDSLFSSDKDLIAVENNILGYLIKGRSSYLDFHRQAQEQILDWLWSNGYSKQGVNYEQKIRLTKWDILDYEDVRSWSTFMCLRLIYQSIRNAKDDVFKDKAKTYEGLELSARNQAALRIDLNKDKKADASERLDTWSGTVFRR